jgi:hypothetical protein
VIKARGDRAVHPKKNSQQSIGQRVAHSHASAPANRSRGGGQIGHVRAPLIEDQVEAGAQPVLAVLERRDAGVVAADLPSGPLCRPKHLALDAGPAPEVG